MRAQRDPHRVARHEVDEQERGERDDEQHEQGVQTRRREVPDQPVTAPSLGTPPTAQLFQTSQRFHQPLSSVWKFCTFEPSPVRAGTKNSGTHGASSSVSRWIWPKTFLRFASFVVEFAWSVSVPRLLALVERPEALLHAVRIEPGEGELVRDEHVRGDARQRVGGLVVAVHVLREQGVRLHALDLHVDAELAPELLDDGHHLRLRLVLARDQNGDVEALRRRRLREQRLRLVHVERIVLDGLVLVLEEREEAVRDLGVAEVDDAVDRVLVGRVVQRLADELVVERLVRVVQPDRVDRRERRDLHARGALVERVDLGEGDALRDVDLRPTAATGCACCRS